MPSKNNLKRSVSAAEKKNAGSQKSEAEEPRCDGKPGSAERDPLRQEPASGSDQEAGEVQAKDESRAIVALAKTTRNSGSFPRKPRAPLPRMRLAEAMRSRGLDEHFIARVALMFIRARVAQKKFDKLLVDMVEKVIRVLEPPRPADRTAAEPPAQVQLIHYVDRPDRENHSDDIPDPSES
ncbi:MAG TPA: hypothetical protein VEU52_06085 [Candidatus Limnocylindrales bacterium]|nr:hypothetical protein [Candidatus Limnocylindrales bacterium]